MDIIMLQVTPFWPVTDSLKMYVKYQDSLVSSQHFSIHKPHKTALRMDKGVSLTKLMYWQLDFSRFIESNVC